MYSPEETLRDRPRQRDEQLSDVEETVAPGSTAETYARTFGFLRPEGDLRREVVARHIGTPTELMSTSARQPHLRIPASAQRIIEAFEGVRTTVRTPSGRAVKRRPHLLVTGGFVRDILLGKPPKDIDFATNLTYEDVHTLLSEVFSDDIAAGEVTLKKTGEAFPVLRIHFRGGEEYEIATFRKESGYNDGRHPEVIEPIRYAGEDADRRDFTVNALFYNPRSGNVIDYVGGLKDIDDRILRFVGDPKERIREDKLRMLRYVRFLRKTGFPPDAASLETIRAHAREITDISWERIKDECEKAFEHGEVGTFLELLHVSGLLEHILPDVAALDACEQGPPHHLEGNALRHTALVASALPKDAPKELIWAAIFHDVGKIATRTEMVDKNGNTKVQFLGHEKKSADILQERFARMREHKKTAWLPFSNTEQERILALVRDHIAILEAFPNMRPARAERFVDEHGELFPQLIALAEADTAGSYGDEATNTLHQETLRAIKDRYAMICAEKQRRAETSGTTDIAKLLDGRTIQDIFQEIYSVPLAPGPAVGFLKNAALEVALDKGLSDPGAIREALKEVIRTYPPDVLPKAPSKRR